MFQCGHILAVCRGGTNNIDNLMPVCQLCNNSMYHTGFYEFQATLKSNKKSN